MSVRGAPHYRSCEQVNERNPRFGGSQMIAEDADRALEPVQAEAVPEQA
jgi:hypothetical protein